MTAVFSENLRIQNAINFKEQVSRQLGNNRLYFCFGKCTGWANDAAPEQANTTLSSFNNVWRNMIGAKLLTGNEIKHVIPRHDWTANVSYSAFDDRMDSTDLFDANNKFYVVTSDWNVYKCLSNNTSANSTVMPTQLFTDRSIEELDGYVWKYMYTVMASDQLRFTTDDYIPIKTIESNDNSLQWQVQDNAVEGALEAILVTNPGELYANASLINITITGDGSGANAVARVNTISQTLSNIAITAKGSDYSYATVTITDASGNGVNAFARAVISPTGGHGKDALRELGGNALILNPRLQNSETGKFPIINDYREVSIICAPFDRGTSNIASNAVYSQFQTVIMDSSAAQYVNDEVVYQGVSLANATFTGIIEEWDSANSTIKLINNNGTLMSDVLIGANSGAARFVQSITQYELEPFSGHLMYLDHLPPITRASDQIEDFKIALVF